MENSNTEHMFGKEILRNVSAGASVVNVMAEVILRGILRSADEKIKTHYGRPLRFASAS